MRAKTELIREFLVFTAVCIEKKKGKEKMANKGWIVTIFAFKSENMALNRSGLSLHMFISLEGLCGLVRHSCNLRSPTTFLCLSQEADSK